MHTNSFSRRDFIKAGAAGTLVTGISSPLAGLANSRGITGQAAPELQVPYWIDGKGKQTKAFSVSANKGKWVFLKCFQHWCPGCHAQGFPSLQKLVNAFGQHDQVAIAAIQTTFEGFFTNTQSALLKNQNRYELDIPFGHDSGDDKAEHGDRGRYPSTMVNYRTGGTPWMVVINPQGTVVYNNFHINMDKLIEHIGQQLS